MDIRAYLSNLATLTVGLIVMGLALRFGAGERWFGFFGAATVALAAIPILGFVLLRRYRTLALSRWPVVLILLLVVIAAIVQIGFWVAFFTTGTEGLGLAFGRAMVLPIIEPWLPIAGLVATAAVLWLIIRGALKR